MTTHSVRLASFDGIRESALELGVDPEPIFRSNGLPPAGEYNPDARIPYIALINTLNRLAEATRTPHFGLLVARRQPLTTMGLLGAVAAEAPTVGQAIADIGDHLKVHINGARAICEVEKEIATWRVAVDLEGAPDLKQKHLLSVGLGFNILRQLLGPGWLPSRVQFDHAQPEDVRPYKQFFRCPVLFGQEFSCLCFPSELLQRTNGDKGVSGCSDYGQLKSALEISEQSLAGGFAATFQNTTREAIEQGTLSLDHVAAALDMSRRTLHRRLHEELGTNFREASDKIRIQLGMKYIRNTTLPLSDIADILGYSELAAFSRAFKRKVGCSPKQWRAVA
ncbi:AraC family transcriptional regulator [Microbulbifer bruguierae]|uniref:AraC family transcriptional regulator n=1 Tax=Microbulbifer bruguierae TaxID=3029061 RepID=A0ABY8NB76_9GAMM|nr:AraC family transcriptional regulator [Microbulbifer bruguierae]WGL16185.1 AraC family transcriptional regulator [Microbulbifer bruguierae]